MEYVAPFAGAWIEIENTSYFKSIKTVAPFAGAWIEINCFRFIIITVKSLPSRERGLKCLCLFFVPKESVAPFAGAWIEMGK